MSALSENLFQTGQEFQISIDHLGEVNTETGTETLILSPGYLARY